MKKPSVIISTLAVAIAMLTSTIMPSDAATMPRPQTAAQQADSLVISAKVLIRRGHRYYNGHRGYAYRRHGYRRYNGFWFPAAAFIGAAVIIGAPVTMSIRSCRARYRSYRASDDTYQPRRGPRMRCR